MDHGSLIAGEMCGLRIGSSWVRDKQPDGITAPGWDCKYGNILPGHENLGLYSGHRKGLPKPCCQDEVCGVAG